MKQQTLITVEHLAFLFYELHFLYLYAQALKIISVKKACKPRYKMT